MSDAVMTKPHTIKEKVNFLLGFVKHKYTLFVVINHCHNRVPEEL